MAHHDYFGEDCGIGGRHQVGDRHWSYGSLDQEWTGDKWVPVCPTDDVPMCDRDSQSWLCCGICKVLAVDADVRREPPAPRQ